MKTTSTFTKFYRNILVLICMITGLTASANEYYWVGGGGNWTDFASHWATTSGGSSFYLQIPQSGDNVHFDVNSFTASGKTITLNVAASCNNMDWTGVSNTPTFAGSSALNIYGSMFLASGMNVSLSSAISFLATSGVQTINTFGKSLSSNLTFNGVGGSWTFAGPVVTTGTINLLAGSLNTNSQAVNASVFGSSGSLARSLTLGSTVFTVSDYNTPWSISSSTGMTLNAGTSSIICTWNNAGYAPNFTGGSFTYYDVSFTGALNFRANVSGGLGYHNITSATGLLLSANANAVFNDVLAAGAVQINNSNTFNSLTLSAGYVHTFGANTIQTVGSLIASGTCNAVLTLNSGSAGTQATIKQLSGAVNLSYINLRDINATGGAVFTANNAINSGNNTGWTINTLSSRNLYWIGNSGNWSDGSHWSQTSGGVASGCPPTGVDNVFFDANSFTTGGRTVTVDVAASCINMDWTGVTNTPTFAGSAALNIYGSMVLASGMNVSLSSAISFLATSGVQTINTFGKSLSSNLTFNGVGGSWTFAGPVVTTGTINLLAGSLNTNSQAVNASVFGSSGSLARSLTLGSTVFTVSDYNTPWSISSSTGMTLNAGTSSIICTWNNAGYAPNFTGGSFTYYDVSFTGALNFRANVSGGLGYHNITSATGLLLSANANAVFNDVLAAGAVQINNSNTFNSLTLSAGYVHTFGANTIQTVGSLIASGTCNAVLTLNSGSAGTQATIKQLSGAVNLSYINLRDINATGGAVFTANNAINSGNNTGWTINTLSSRNLYWIGNSGNWSDGSHWSQTSGGVASGCPPTGVDNVFFDANSFTTGGRTVTVDVAASCINMDWTGVTNTPTFAGSAALNIYGSMVLASGMNVSLSSAISFLATSGVQTINTFGKSLSSNLTFNGVGGSWTFAGPVVTTGTINLLAGSLNTNSQAVNASVFGSSGSLARSLTLGSTVFTVSDYNTPWSISSSTGMTLNAGTSSIICTWNNAGYAPNFTGGSFTYYDVSFTGALNFRANVSGGLGYHNITSATGLLLSANANAVFNDVVAAGAVQINNSNTFHNLTFSPGTINTISGTQTITGTWNATGTGGFPITVNGTGTLSKSSGTVCNDYLRLSNMTATGGAAWNVGANGQNVTGNTGWNFAPNIITISVSITSSSPCVSNPMTFTAVPVNGGGATYEWFLNNVSVQNSSSLTYTNSSVNVGDQVKCIMTSTFNCGTPITSNSNIITIAAQPVATASSNSPVTVGSTINLTSSGGATYAWTGPNSFVSNQQNPSISGATTAAAGTYTVTITTAGGCNATASTNVAVNTVPAGALNFDKTKNNYVNCGTPASFDFTTGYTIEAWVNLADNGGWYGIVSKEIWGAGTGWVLYVAQQGLTFTNGGFGNGAISGGTIPIGQWAHVAVSNNNGVATIYVNGNPVASGNVPVNNSSVPLAIGSRHSNDGSTFGDYFNGSIDEVRIFNRALCQAEIQSSMNCEIPTTNNGLVGNYHFNTGSVNTNNAGLNILTDASGAGNNGALSNNFTLSGATSNWVAGSPVSGSCTPFVAPTATITPGGSTAICSGSSVQLTASAGSSYLWSNGATSQSITVSDAGDYSVTVITPGGCSAVSAVTTVTVSPVPSNPSATGAARCGTGSVTLTATPGSGGDVIDWYTVSSGGSAVATGNSYTTPSISSTTQYYTATRNTTTGCSSSRTQVNATINPIPGGASILFANPTNCGPGTLIVRASAGFNGDAIKWYTASSGGTFLSSNSSYTVSISTTTTYYAASYNTSTGCEASFRAPANAIIYQQPPAPSPANVTGATICGSGSVILSVSNSNGYSVRWYQFPTGSGSLGSSNNFNTFVSSTTTYYVANVDFMTNCESATRTPVTATVNPVPSISGVAGITNVCSGSATVLTASSTAASPVFKWYTSSFGGSPEFTGASYTTPAINANTTYYVDVTSGGCTSSRTAVNITVNALPVPTITANGPLTICEGSAVVLTASVGSSYLWSNGEITQSISANTAGNYTVAVTDANSCNASASVNVQVDAMPVLPEITGNQVYVGKTSQLSNGVPGGVWSSSYGNQNSYYTLGQSGLVTGLSPFYGYYDITYEVTQGACTAYAYSSIYVSNLPATGLHFNGNSNYIDAERHVTDLGNSSSFTIEMSIKTTTPNTGLVTCDNGDNNWSWNEKSFYLDQNGFPTFVGFNCNYIRSNMSVTDGQWHHVAVTWATSGYANGIGKIYIDGVDHTGNVDYAPSSGDYGTFKIGKPNFGEANQYFNGTMDEVRIWNRPLCATELLNNKNCELVGNETGLMLYYKLNKGFVNANNYSYNAAEESRWYAPRGVLHNFLLDGAVSNWAEGIVNGNCSVIELTGQPIIGNATICQNGGTQLSVTTGGGVWSSSHPSIASIDRFNGNVYGQNPGTATITHIDDCGAVSIFEITVNPVPAAADITVNGSSVLCANGSVSMSVPANNNYTYQWVTGANDIIPGATTNAYTATTPNYYQVILTDKITGCTSTIGGASVQSFPVPVIKVNGPAAFCVGGSRVLDATPGANEQNFYTGYTWSTPGNESTPFITVNQSGTYTVTATDGNCTATSVPVVITAAENTLRLTAALTSPTTCANVCDGSITLTPSGGVAPYSFKTVYDFSGNTIDNSLFTVIENYPGYNAVFTQSGGTLSYSDYAPAIVYTNKKVASEGNISFEGSFKVDNDLVFGFSTENSISNRSNFKMAFHYSGGTLNVFEKGVDYSPIIDLNYLPNTWVDYKIVKTGTVVNYYSRASGAANYDLIYTSTYTGSGSVNFAVCNNYGTSYSTYFWSIASDPKITGLCSGDYTYTVMDAAGCSASVTITVPVSTAPGSLQLAATATGGTCAGGCVGTVTLQPTGGTAPYQYGFIHGFNGSSLDESKFDLTNATFTESEGSLRIDPNANLQIAYISTKEKFAGSTDLSMEFSFKFDQTSGGNHASIGFAGLDQQNSYVKLGFMYTNNTLYVNGNGQQQIDLNNPFAISTDTWYDFKVVKTGTTITYYARESGSGAYTLVHTMEDTQTYGQLRAIAGGQEFIIPGYWGGFNTKNWIVSAQPKTIGLCAGTYTYTVFDASGCSATATATVVTDVNFTVNAAVINTTAEGVCDGSVAFTSSTPGTLYTAKKVFEETFAGNSISNAFEVVNGNFSVNGDLYGAPIGGDNGFDNYIATNQVFPYNGKFVFEASLKFEQDNNTYFGIINGSIANQNLGGYPYAFYYFGNANQLQIRDNSPGGASVDNFASGIWYDFKIEKTGTTVKYYYRITGDQDYILIYTNTTAFDFAAGYRVGFNYYSYTSGFNVKNLSVTGFVPANTSGLCAGTYTYTIVSEGGCSQDVTFTIGKGREVIVSTEHTNAACYGSNGTITITATGGTPAFQYSADGGTTYQSSNTFNLPAGTYTMVVKDVNGTVSTAQEVTITQPAEVTTPIVTVVDNCDGTSTLSTTATGTLLWNTLETTSTIVVHSANTYTVTQTVDGCTSAAGSGIASPKTTPVTPVVTVVDNCDGTSTLSTASTGGLLWSTYETTSTIVVHSANTYTVTQTADGCTSAAGSGVASPKTTPATPVVTVVDNCNGTSTLSTTAVGGLLWSTNESTSTITVHSANTYTVTQTINGCTSAAGSGVAAPKTNPIVAAIGGTTSVCAASATQLVNNTTGGVWSSSNASVASVDNTGLVTGVAAGNANISYTVTVNGCTTAVSSSVTVNALPTITSVTDQVVCEGSATTAINFGGTGNIFNWTNSNASIGLGASGSGSIPSFIGLNNGITPITANITVTPVFSGTSIAYVPEYFDGYVSVVNTSTNAIVTTIPVGTGPYGVTVSPDGSHVYVANLSSQNISVINTANNTVAATITVGFGPKTTAISADGSRLYVTNNTASNVSVINTATNTVIGTIPIGGVANGPTGICISPDASKIYITNQYVNTVTVINTATNAIITHIPVGTNPQGIAISADGSRVYAVNYGTNNVSVINTASNAVIATVAVGTNPAWAAVTPDGTKVYVSNNSSGNISVINTATNAVSATVALGGAPRGVTVGSEGSKVYVDIATAVKVLSTSTDAVINTITFTPGYNSFALGNFIKNGGSGCAGVATAFSVTVNPLPAATITAAASTAICAGGSVKLDANTGEGLTYQWKKDGVNINTAINASYDSTGAGSYTVVVTNSNGCSKTSSATVVTVNQQLQFVTCPSNISVSTTAGLCSAVVNYTTTAIGEPSPVLSYTFTGATTGSGSGTGSGSIFNKGLTTVTITAANLCGSVTCSFTVAVIDNQAPTVITKNITVYLDATGHANITAAQVDNGSSDNCGSVVLSVSKNSFDCSNLGANNVTLTVADGVSTTNTDQQNTVTGTLAAFSNVAQTFTAGSTGTLSAVELKMSYWTVTNPTGKATLAIYQGAGVNGQLLSTQIIQLHPEATYPNIATIEAYTLATPVPVVAGQVYSIVIFGSGGPFDIDLATNNPYSGGQLININGAPGNYFQDFNSFSTWDVYFKTIIGGSAQGNGGNGNQGQTVNQPVNTATGTAIVTVVDNSKPVVNCPQGISRIAANCNALININTPTATDNCSATVTGVRSDNLALSAPYPVGVTTITWTAKDPSNNISDPCVQTITVTAPEINVKGNGISIVSGDNTPSTTDNTDMGGTLPGVPLSKTFTIENTGNAPLLLTGILGSGVQGANFGINGAPTFPATITPGSTATFTVSFLANAVGTYNLTVNATSNDCDEANYSFVVQAAVTCSMPVFTTSPTATSVFAAAGLCNAVVNYTALVSGIPEPGLTYTFTGATTGSGSGTGSGSVFNKGVTTVMITATNVCGTASMSFTVTVADNQFPALNGVPAAITVECNEVPVAAIVTATDNCATSVPSYSEIRTDGTCPNKYTLTRTWSTTDASGNTTTASQVITVQDTKAPVLSDAPANITVECNAVPVAAILTATDNCETPAVVYTEVRTDGSNPSNYTLTRKWTATDACGNTSSKTQVITVHDITAPVISCPAPVTLNCQDNNSSAATGVATATDNCTASASIAITQSDVSTYSADPSNVLHYNYTISRTWRATDIAGNYSECVQTITVRDITKPVIIVPSAITLNCQDNTAPANTGTATGTDICSPVTITYSDASTQATSLTSAGHYNYVITRTWTATDVTGNYISGVQTITVRDITKPIITVPSAITLNCQDNTSPANTGTATGTDICSPVTISYSDVSTQVTSLASAGHYNYTITRTWTATDVTGNYISGVQTITVRDITKPVITVPSAITLNCQDNTAPANTGTATGTDICSPVTISYSDVSTQVTSLTSAGHYNYTITRTWTATDVTGNNISGVQTITVRDITKPVIVTCPPSVTQCNDQAGNIRSFNFVATDNCSPLTTSYTIVGPGGTVNGTGNTITTGFAVGTTTITWTVKDVSLNSNTCTTTVVINPLPVASITAATADAFCNGFVLSGGSTLTGPFTYQWLCNNQSAGTTQNITLGLTNGDGVYTLFTTDGKGCRSATGAVYSYQKQNLVSSYTIIAEKEVDLGKYNKVASGSVGITSSKGEAEFKAYSSVNGAGSFVKAPKIDKDGSGIVINSQLIGIAYVTLPVMQYNTVSTNNLPNYTASVNNATLTGSYKTLTVKKGISVTVTANTFGSIKLEEGASIRFTATVLNIAELVADKGAKNDAYTYIRFNQNTSVRVSGKVSIGSQVLVNPESNKVTFYMGDLNHDEEKFTVKGGDTRVIANIYMPDGKLRVTATDSDNDDHVNCDHKAHDARYCQHKNHDHNDCEHTAHSAASCNDDVYMTGLFIAEEVESKGNTVIWNSYDCSATAPAIIVNSVTPVMQSVAEKVQTTVSTEEELKVTVMPNPSTTYFTLKLESKYETPVNMRVMDASGRVIDAKSKIGANSMIQIGHNYSSGTYYAELIQGTKRKVVQLIKSK
ncbi:MAG: LamG-like jellyroll fold domain-containing protein [Bacteroidota bacterium]